MKKNQKNLKILWKSKKIKIDPKITPNDLKNEKITSKMKNWPQKWKFWKRMKILKIFRKSKKNQKSTRKSPQMTSKMKKWPQKWQIDLKNENFEKKWKFWKFSENLKKIKNRPENSPQNDLKNEKLTSKMKILEKMKIFKIFRQSRKK